MATRVPAGLTRFDAAAESAGTRRRAGRRFGFTLGAAFAALGLLFGATDRRTASAVCVALAVALLGGALLAPAALVHAERWWMALARLLSRVTTPVMLGAIYFLVLTPIALVMRIARRSPLAVAPDGAGVRSAWVMRPPASRRSALRRQY